MPGPKADPSRPYSRHRERGSSARKVVVLPERCDLPAPEMPAGREWSEAERDRWAELWSSPQAVMWDVSYVSAVAMYVSHVSAVLAGAASAWHAQESRHLAEQLGLTPRGMLALGWVLEPPEPPAQESATVTPIRGA
ncbi:hypothetical protein AB0H37_14670 [Actinomadura sp. NPDC023710]|uniref:phage terminase small subunit n=1 Tax=Actinomadura sp. NPDC023710 TaxID=3158219 RepID=UPI0033F2036C